MERYRNGGRMTERQAIETLAAFASRPMTEERVKEMIAFLERSRHSLMVTCDINTGEPLFAHFRGSPDEKGFPRRLEDSIVVEWAREPDAELRAKEQRVRARLLFSEIREDIEHDRLPWSLRETP